MHDALDHYQACTNKQLKEILYTHFAIAIHFSRNIRRGNDIVLISPLAVQLPSVNASEVGLCLDDIKAWLPFNHILKDHPLADRVRQGVMPLFL
ncbi:hypothetical protein GO730_26760 [Spirosoma sp. HMF3257]|uniref:Uncharacterized protein n=1 Tax=Spirosoma telluris TaxID=2183553 RepID=A0A327NQ71_9BACT|nr:hypothetical protein [Spirosoma telluris]RAI76863.1 hypothetical protein HMF3257_26690 [Spirosoma telluris]